MKSRLMVQLLVTSLEEAYQKKSWHGTNLRGSLRGLSAAEASWRPSSRRHNIWETALHCAYWKYAVRRRLTGEKRGSFPVKGSNWFQRPLEFTSQAWKHDLAVLDHEHRMLMEVVEGLTDTDLYLIPRGRKVSNRAILTGIAAHDIYHAGQIQLLKRLQSDG